MEGFKNIIKTDKPSARYREDPNKLEMKKRHYKFYLRN